MVQEKRIGIALSGGGARGFAHLGILKAFEEANISIDVLAGTSMGAIIAAFWAKGYKADEIFTLLHQLKLRQFIRWRKPHQSLFSYQKIYKFLKNYFPDNQISSLQKPLTITCTNLIEGNLVSFSEGELLEALIGSFAIPALLEPVKFRDMELIDGGIIQNLPSEVIRQQCDYLIGVHCNPLSKKSGKNMRENIERTFIVAVQANISSAIALCDLFIEPPNLSNYRFADIKKAPAIFEEGYWYAKKLVVNF
ncbi:MAG: patatin-like phospholipase family protein [Thermonemataceae bacterium]|nr:patatin-like phospholipase family protein [Thermonemataceae bacterium]